MCCFPSADLFSILSFFLMCHSTISLDLSSNDRKQLGIFIGKESVIQGNGARKRIQTTKMSMYLLHLNNTVIHLWVQKYFYPLFFNLFIPLKLTTFSFYFFKYLLYFIFLWNKVNPRPQFFLQKKRIILFFIF